MPLRLLKRIDDIPCGFDADSISDSRLRMAGGGSGDGTLSQIDLLG